MDMQKYWDSAYGAVIEFGPRLLAALAILIVAYFIGKALSKGAKYLIDRSTIGKGAAGGQRDLGESVGTALYWLTILVALPAALGVLGLDGLLKPMQTLVEKILVFLPNLFAAGLIFGIGWVVATVARRAITSTLRAANADKIAERFGLRDVTGETGISNFSGVLVFTLLIIPIAIAALDALSIQSVAEPAKVMLQSILEAIPRIFAAAVVILIGYIIGRFASDTLAALLPATGLDKVAEGLGLKREVFAGRPLSTLAGYAAFIAIVLFSVIEAAKLLQFAIVSEMLASVLTLGGQILLGTVIIVVGVVVSDFIRTILAKSKDAAPIAQFVRIAVIVLAVAMGLQQMGVADEIVHTGFTLLLGALAVGGAIAIGWGGKETAGRLLEKWTKEL